MRMYAARALARARAACARTHAIAVLILMIIASGTGSVTPGTDCASIVKNTLPSTSHVIIVSVHSTPYV